MLSIRNAHLRQTIAGFMLLAASTWAGTAAGTGNGNGQPSVQQPAAPDETAPAASLLRAAGWRVVSVDASTPLSVAWLQLPGASGLSQVANTRWRPDEPREVV